MKQLPATASAAHDWAHLTHGAADPKNQQHDTLLTHRTACIHIFTTRCRSPIEVLFYGVAEVLQRDAIDLIYLTTT